MSGIERSALPVVTDEIGLGSLWRVLVKRKYFVLAIPLLTVLMAIAYLSQITPIYQSRAVILVGQVRQGGQPEPLEVPAVLVMRLKERYGVGEAGAAVEMPRIAGITQNKSDVPNAITFLAHDRSAQGAQAYLVRVVNAVLAEHAMSLTRIGDASRERMQSIDRQVGMLNDYIASLSKQIETIRVTSPVQASILVLEKGRALAEKIQFEQETTHLRLVLSGMQSQPSKLLLEPVLPVSSVDPKRSAILSLAVVLGVMLGLFCAFAAEALLRLRDKTD